MKLENINPSLQLFNQSQEVNPAEDSKESFGAYLKNSMDDVNRLMIQSDQKGSDLAVGKAENLHDAMITFEKAETAFKLLVQVRNRAVEAYHEIMRMQM